MGKIDRQKSQMENAMIKKMGSQMIDKNQRVFTLDNGQIHVETVNQEPTLAQQQFKDECDINNIMKRYADTGQLTHLRNQTGVFADFSEIPDYQGSLNRVLDAQNAFMQLPAEVRTRFRNDPGYLIDFLQDPNNYDEALKLGLVNERQKTEVQKTNDLNEQKQTGVKKAKTTSTPQNTEE